MKKLSFTLIILTAVSLVSCTSGQQAGTPGSIVESQQRQPVVPTSTNQVSVTSSHIQSVVVSNPLPTQPTPNPLQFSIEFSKYNAAEFQMQASNLRREGEYVIVDVCFITPDRNDWQIMYATYQNGDQQVSVDSETLGEMQLLSEGSEKGYRCTELYFVAPGYEDISTSVLTIHSLREFLREGNGCEKYLSEVKMALESQDIAIEFDCREDHSTNLKIIKVPSHITEDEALRLLFEYYTVDGNWEFTFE